MNSWRYKLQLWGADIPHDPPIKLTRSLTPGMAAVSEAVDEGDADGFEKVEKG